MEGVINKKPPSGEREGKRKVRIVLEQQLKSVDERLTGAV